MMIGLGFPAFETTLMCLIANSAPVAYGSLGNPVRTLVAVTGLPEADFSAMLGRILPWTVLILPFWLLRVLCNTRDTLAVWPGLLAGGLTFAAIQFLWSNYVDASLVDLVAGAGTLAVLAIFFQHFWKPKTIWRYGGEARAADVTSANRLPVRRVLWAWFPFLLLAAFVVVWGLPKISHAMDELSFRQPVPGLHLQTVRMPPVVLKPEPQAALFDGSWLASPGTGVFFWPESSRDFCPVCRCAKPSKSSCSAWCDCGGASWRFWRCSAPDSSPVTAGWTPPWAWRWRIQASCFRCSER